MDRGARRATVHGVTESDVSEQIAFLLSCFLWESPCWLSGKESACDIGDLGSTPGSGNYPKKEMAIQSSNLAWEIP